MGSPKRKKRKKEKRDIKEGSYIMDLEPLKGSQRGNKEKIRKGNGFRGTEREGKNQRK